MKRYLSLIVLVLAFCTTAAAEGLAVKSFTRESNDVSAAWQRNDAKGQPCALIKVNLPIANVRFKGDVVGKTICRKNAYYVYVPTGTKGLSLELDGVVLLNLSFSDFGFDILNGLAIYSLDVDFDPLSAYWNDFGLTYYTFDVSPNSAVLEVEGYFYGFSFDGTLGIYFPKGKHSYRIVSDGYKTMEGVMGAELDKRVVQCQLSCESNK